MKPANAGCSEFNPDLSIIELPGLIFVKYDDGRTSPIPKCFQASVRCRSYPSGAGILTCFPFPLFGLRQQLGSTNPRLTKHCRGTLALKEDGILTHLGYYYRQDSQYCAVHPFSRTSFCPRITPPYQINLPLKAALRYR